jgi:hypothetical protein
MIADTLFLYTSNVGDFAGGKSGKLLDVLRTTNTVDTYIPSGIPGGVNYVGAERSDVHGAIVIEK